MLKKAYLATSFLGLLLACDGNEKDSSTTRPTDFPDPLDEEDAPTGDDDEDRPDDTENGDNSSTGAPDNEDRDDGGNDGDDGDDDDEFEDDADDAESEDTDADAGTGSDDTESEDTEEEDAPSDASVIFVRGTDLPTSIPPTGTTGIGTSLAETEASGSIVDINLHVDLEHTCTKDLVAILVSPSGTIVEVFDLRPMPVCSSDLEGTILDDEALSPLLDGSTPFTGRYQPPGSLSDFDGEDPAGVWQISIEDGTPADSGTLTNWALEITVD